MTRSHVERTVSRLRSLWDGAARGAGHVLGRGCGGRGRARREARATPSTASSAGRSGRSTFVRSSPVRSHRSGSAATPTAPSRREAATRGCRRQGLPAHQRRRQDALGASRRPGVRDLSLAREDRPSREVGLPGRAASIGRRRTSRLVHMHADPGRNGRTRGSGRPRSGRRPGICAAAAPPLYDVYAAHR